jgi:hypothetical protein
LDPAGDGVANGVRRLTRPRRHVGDRTVVAERSLIALMVITMLR